MVFDSHSQLSESIDAQMVKGSSIGFVPTMGALHDGHLSLMKRALQENDRLVVSVFVNPTQFNNEEDLNKYPRTLQQDVHKIEQAFPTHDIFIYAPTVDDVYGSNAVSKNYDFGALENVMEGAHRPGHFDGVGTVLEFLFKVVRPDRAYFGEKDYQQLQVIKKLVDLLKINIEIIGCPIYRESSGLAMSSRNGRLDAVNFERAAFIYATMVKAREYFKSHTMAQTHDWVERAFKENPDFELEYFTIANEQTLIPDSVKSSHAIYRAFVVAHLQGVRLIDNLSFHQ